MTTTLSIQAKKIIAFCEANWEANKSDCSGYIKAVAKDQVISLSGNADGTTDYLSSLPTQTYDGATASRWAEQGDLVVGRLKGDEHIPSRCHGHVVIVVPGEISHDKYPVAFWGTLGSEGKKHTPLNWALNHNDCDHVVFAALPLA